MGNFQYRGHDCQLDATQILKLSQREMVHRDLSLGERKQLSGLIEGLTGVLTRCVMRDVTKEERASGEIAREDLLSDHILFHETLGQSKLFEVMEELRQPEINMEKLVGQSYPQYERFKLSGAIHVLYDQSDTVRVWALILGTKALPKTIIETEG